MHNLEATEHPSQVLLDFPRVDPHAPWSFDSASALRSIVSEERACWRGMSDHVRSYPQPADIAQTQDYKIL